MPVILLFHRNYISNENQKLWIAKYPALCSFKLEFIEVVVVQAIRLCKNLVIMNQ